MRNGAIDRLAIGVSGLCLVHCIASAVFLAVLASAGGLLLGMCSHAAAETVARAANGPKTLVVKSTVSPGTGSKIAAVVEKLSAHRIAVVNNPEFLREGTAIQDFMQPDRIVFGAVDGQHSVLREIYQPLIDKGDTSGAR